MLILGRTLSWVQPYYPGTIRLNSSRDLGLQVRVSEMTKMTARLTIGGWSWGNRPEAFPLLQPVGSTLGSVLESSAREHLSRR